MANKEKKDWKRYLPLAVVIIVVVVAGINWYVNYTKYIKTDDAFVTSDVVTVSPKMMGRICAIHVQEGDSVKQGQLMAELDSADLLAQKQQTLSGKLQTQAGKAQAEAKLQFDSRNIEIQKINVARSQDDFDRGKTQYAGGVQTKEQFDHLKKALESAQAQLAAAQAQWAVSKTQIRSAEASVVASQSQIDLINTQLRNTKLYAPTDGVVAKRWLLPGDIANVGQSIYTINNTTKFWIMVYLEETKLGELHLGQPADFTVDTYPDATFHGKIFLLGSTTASQFSLIPASNASGNFTKVTQRVPVKISIDGVDAGAKLSDFRLMTGMSAVVKILR